MKRILACLAVVLVAGAVMTACGTADAKKTEDTATGTDTAVVTEIAAETAGETATETVAPEETTVA